MALSMTVNGNTESALSSSLSINDNINARSTIGFSMLTDNTITVGQEIIVLDGATRIFGGTIDSYQKSYLRGSGGNTSRQRYDIVGVDFNQITDRRRVAATYENQTVSFIVNDIVTNYLTGENITVGTIAKGTTVVAQAVFNYVTVGEAFNFIRDAAGGDLNWNIDYNKELTFFQRADNTGNSFNDSNCFQMVLSETRKDYRNSQLVRAGDSTTEVQQDEEPQPKPDGVSRTFRARFPLATKPVIEINLNGAGWSAVDPSDIGILGLDTGKKWYWQKNSKDIAQDQAETVLGTVDAIRLDYQGLKPIIVQASNPTGQAERSAIEGGTGIYSRINDKRDLDDKSAALEYANGLLVRYGTIPRNINILTDEYRQAGQLVQVQSNNLGVNEDFLITNVSVVDFDGCGTLRYNISGASGEDVGTWIEFFRSLTVSGELSIKENEVLVILETLIENQGWTGQTTVKVFEPPICSETLICSESLIVGNPVLETEVIND